MNSGGMNDPVISNAADVLGEMALDIERIGAELCADREVAGRHYARLQDMDRFAQTSRHLAEVLRSDCRSEAANNVRLEALQAKLVGSPTGNEQGQLPI